MAGNIIRVDHIGIAVADLEEAIRLYTALFGTGPESVEEVPDQSVRTALFRLGETHVELLCPTSEDSPICGFLAKRGAGIHHICLEVPDLERALADAKARGMRLIDEAPRSGARGKRIAFVHPKSTGGVLLEFSETPRGAACTQHPRAPHAAGGTPPEKS